MKVAITGASGFVGNHVLKLLLKESVDIVAVTRNSKKLDDFLGLVTIVDMDISSPPSNVFDILGRPDILIHLAWDGLSSYKSLHHFEVELPKHYHFLSSLINAGLSSLLVSGTCLEYGMKSGCLKESVMTSPKTSYGYAKDALRQQLEYLQQVSPFNFTWARLFYMFGDGQSRNSLFPALKGAVLTGQEIFNMSGGEQQRDYLPIQEVAKRLVIFSLMERNIGIVNICSGKPILIKNLVKNWIEKNDWDIKLNLGYYPYPDYEVMEFWGDATKQNIFLENK